MIFSFFNKLSDYVKEERTAEIVVSLQLGAEEAFCRAGEWLLVITEAGQMDRLTSRKLTSWPTNCPDWGEPRPWSSAHLPSRLGYLFLENSLFVNKL